MAGDGVTEGGELPLQANDPHALLALYASLNDMNGNTVQIKINKYVEKCTGAMCTLMIQLWKGEKEGVVQVYGSLPLEQEVRFPITSWALKSVLEEKCCYCTPYQKLDEGLVDVIRRKTAESAHSVLVPIVNADGVVVLVICLLFQQEQSKPAQSRHQAIVTECFRYFYKQNNITFQNYPKTLNSLIILIVLFKGDVRDLIKEIVCEACKLTKAESCSMFLLDDKGFLVAKVFDGKEPKEEVKLKAEQGVAGHVASTGKLINIRDAYSHPLFYNAIDQQTGFRTRNILCFPIINKDKVIGVVELCNKKDGYHFDVFDEEVAMAFSVYCGISIMHSLVYKRVQDAQARNKLSNELMIYHMKVADEDVRQLTNCREDHILAFPEFFDFSFPTRTIPRKVTVHIAFQMFEVLGFVKRFQIDRDHLAKFLLYIQRGYRDTPYHNWDHAFSVFHLLCLLLRNLNLIEKGHLTWVQGLALVVSAVCHDIDHRGTNNQFQMASGTILASLYSSEGSVMERHHVSQTMCILNTEDCNIVSHLNEQEYKSFIDLVSRLIIATDLSNHFRVIDSQGAMAREGYDPTNSQHRELLLHLLMTCGDLCDQIKPWEACHKVTVSTTQLHSNFRYFYFEKLFILQKRNTRARALFYVYSHKAFN
ncbi:cGMP-dependent 3',5'-cyclic phosphodiesterase-like [Nilaparvata lugens]|uniref:cGMP-dependent 3',5'-cyclic phosphodiesterase-like n=1 Tax=Nilaparvata lugens TaxID=108931 RepID=UPI00193E3CDB|nr:cGMP-dependent 3',5'-cyclic phosphodiesterase-like [Nilaparvata lugens]